jgi:hypothetical protein
VPASNGRNSPEGLSVRLGDRGEQQVAQSDADECGDVGLADLRYGDRRRGKRSRSCNMACALFGLLGSLVMAASQK